MKFIYGLENAPDGFRVIAENVSALHVPGVVIAAGNERGFIYALLELAERVRYGRDTMAALHMTEDLKETTPNEIRCVSRYFCSELEDKTWFYDRDFWQGYLDLLAASRFNRFCLGFGLEYDFPKGVTSDYLHFPYPYLVDVPGYDVRVAQLAAPDGKVLTAPVALSAAEREKNLQALQFIAAQTAARGLHFQLGIWTHAYQWTDSPRAYHRIEGLTPQTHAAYCRDALAMLLKLCPEIQGLTLRVHGESGIPEGSYEFWETLFTAVKGCGRTVEIDMHAKGVDEKMIDIAAATGMPVKLGAKYSAEHQSLGYQQADIRALEIPKPGHAGEGPFSLSSGARSFTRYGYADFLKSGSRYKLLFRLWPGTQRHLLSADPEMAAAYGRTAHFCGAVGLDLMEPLTFKGREGSGQPGGRCAYADATLNPKYDWQKFELFYRVWGRRLYDPDANPEAWRRRMRADFGAGAVPMETAVARASRLLPLVTSAHLPSASNHSFWPEIYTNMPIVTGSEPSPYSDTPEPKCFGTVSPLDPRDFFDGRRARRRFTGGQRESQIFADRRGAVAGGLGGSGERGAGCGAAGKRGAPFARLASHGSGCADPGGAGSIFRCEDARGRFVLCVSANAGTTGRARSTRPVPDGARGMGCGGARGGRLSQRHYVWQHTDAARALERSAGGN